MGGCAGTCGATLPPCAATSNLLCRGEVGCRLPAKHPPRQHGSCCVVCHAKQTGTGQVFACPVPILFLYLLICLFTKTKPPCGVLLTALPAGLPYKRGTAARCPSRRPLTALRPPPKGACRKPAAVAPPAPPSGLPPVAHTTRWLAASLF